MGFLQSTFGRVLLGLIFFCTVNGLSGFIAVELRYPSLWGNNSGIFAEYAYPVPYGWALAHWLSMLPLTLIVMGMPLWERSTITKARWYFLTGLVICLLIEFGYGGGRFHRIPFVLFVVVDLSIAFLVSLIFYPPGKALAGISLAVVFIAAGFGLGPSIFRLFGEDQENGQQNHGEKQYQKNQTSLLAPWEIELKNYDEEVHYLIEVVPMVTPGQAPLPEEICSKAEKLYQQMRDQRTSIEGYTERVLFFSHPWFDSQQKYMYPSGEARPGKSGEWVCHFVYPEQP